jgi:hypothetical protein
VVLLVREPDVKTVVNIMNSDWNELLDREGETNSPGIGHEVEEGEPPCPCCGTAAPLVKGACSDCGLQLA